MNALTDDAGPLRIENDTSIEIEGYFRLEPPVDQDSQDVFDVAGRRLTRYLENLKSGASTGNEQIRLMQRVYMERLRSIAEDVCARKGSGSDLLVRLGSANGAYLEQRKEYRRTQVLGAELFPEDAPRELKLTKLDDASSEGERSLFIEIQRTYSVVDIVLSRREQQKKNRHKRENSDFAKRSGALRAEYLRRLKDIADEAKLYPQTTDYAMQKLALFKEAFVSREADHVKNEHIQLLGLRAVMLAVPFLAAYVTVFWLLSPALANSDMFQQIGAFLLLSVGACAGTWLSFSLRRTFITFDDLILLEPDRVHPTGRLIFVVLLTGLVGLLLELEWVGILFSGESVLPSNDPRVALLVGAFCGVAERSLAGVVSGKANEALRFSGEQRCRRGENNMKQIFVGVALVFFSAAANAECALLVNNFVGSDIFVDVVNEDGESVSSNPDLYLLEKGVEEPTELELQSKQCSRELLFLIHDCSAGVTYEVLAEPQDTRDDLPLFFIDKPIGALISSPKVGWGIHGKLCS